MAVVLANMWLAGVMIVGATALYAVIALYTAINRLSFERSILRRQVKVMDIAIDQARGRMESETEKSLSWAGTRKFEVSRREYESPDKNVCSFYIEPHDKRPIPAFEPGQFLTFELAIPDEKKVIRCYSLSDAPGASQYRVSIKRVPPPRDNPDAPPGLSSNWFHDQIQEGDILDVRAPSGKFFLDMNSDRPIVLIGGGVGLTPVLSMLNAVVASNADREVWFFYGVRNGDEHCMKSHLKEVDAAHTNIHVACCYSEPTESDQQGTDYDHAERVSVHLLKTLLPSNNYQFLMCGPPPMMESLIADLKDWGVPPDDILRESFGPASGRQLPPQAPNPDAIGPEITFKRSGKIVRWDPAFDSLIKFAEANDCDIPYACLAGNCGTCLTTIIEGEVDYPNGAPDFEPEDGTCLTCSCIPNGAITLDA